MAFMRRTGVQVSWMSVQLNSPGEFGSVYPSQIASDDVMESEAG